jgi:hypothetical protein
MLCAEALAQLARPIDDFAARYFRWCQQEITREVAANFPTVRRMPWSGALLFLDFAAECSASEIRDFLSEGIKRFNARGAELAGAAVSEEESAAREKFLAYLHPETIIEGRTMSSLRVSPRALAIREAERQRQTTTVFKKKILKEELQRALQPILGEPEDSRGGLQYCLPIGRWYLFTSLDMAGRKQLNFGQWISARRKVDFCPTRLHPAISPLSWLGVHPDTGFDLIQEHEGKEVAATVAALCSQVLQQIPVLLSGLSHQISEDVDDSSHSPLWPNRKRKIVDGS